jgi:plasmid stabilization system protein ParE
MSARYSGRALADLSVIADYISERRPSGAVSVMRRIEATVNLIGRHPGLGSKVRARAGVFALPVGKYPYRFGGDGVRLAANLGQCWVTRGLRAVCLLDASGPR